MLSERFRTWRTVFNTANLPEGMTAPPDAVSKWLVITRAAVFSMTVTSGLIGGLLAVGAAQLTGEVTVHWGLLALAIVGLVVAHAANNMINDYFDLEGGVDTDDYVRALYAPHPILSGWVTKRQLGTAILIANATTSGPRCDTRNSMIARSIALAMRIAVPSCRLVTQPDRIGCGA